MSSRTTGGARTQGEGHWYTQSVGLLGRVISPSQGLYLHTKELRGLSPRANYTDRATADCGELSAHYCR
jgi:hypothetical protein